MSIRDDVKAQFPQYAFLLNDPEVGKLLEEAIDPGMSDLQFMAKLRETNWFKRTSSTERQWLDLLNTDPATANSNIGQRGAALKSMAAEMGFVIPAKRLRKLADWTIRKGMSQDEMKEFVLHSLPKARPVASRQEMRTLTQQYMLGVPSKEFDWWNRQIAAGIRSMDQFEERMRNGAMNKFPQIASLIGKGFLPLQLYSEHQNTIAEEMELDPDAVDLVKDPRWKKVTRPKSDGTMWTIPEVEEYVRGRQEWRHTRRAQTAAAELTSTLLKAFGKKA